MKKLFIFLPLLIVMFVGCKKDSQTAPQQSTSTKHDIVFSATGKGYSTVLSLQSDNQSQMKPAKLDSIYNEGTVYQYKIACVKGQKLLVTVGPGDSKPEVYHYTISDNGKIKDDGIISNVAKGSEIVIPYLVGK